jgi:competence protein ComEC
MLGRAGILALLYPWPSVRVQRSRRAVALLAGLGVAGAYAALAGLSVPTLRAVSMAGAAAVALLAGRPAQGWNALAAAGLVVLSIDPASLFEPAFGLSFLAVSGILLWQPRGGLVLRLTGCTIGASLATAPLLVALGLPVPCLGIVANLLLVPWFTAVVVPLGLVCALLSFISPGAAGLLVPLVQEATGAGIEGAVLLQSPSLLANTASSAVTVAFVAAVFMLRACLRGDFPVAAAAAALVVVLGVPAWPGRPGPPRRDPEILALDVGQGDATLVRSEDTAWLIDAGPRLGAFDAGRRVVLPALRAEGVRMLDVLVLTHPDRDHVGGAAAILERSSVGEIWVASGMLENPASIEIQRAAAARDVPFRIVTAGYEASLGTWRARVLWPPPGFRGGSSNGSGLVVRLEGAKGCAVLPADVPLSVEGGLAESATDCAVLKLGHHGSATSTGARWLDALDPSLAIASASRFRARLYPAPAVRARLLARHVTLYETARPTGPCRLSS